MTCHSRQSANPQCKNPPTNQSFHDAVKSPPFLASSTSQCFGHDLVFLLSLVANRGFLLRAKLGVFNQGRSGAFLHLDRVSEKCFHSFKGFPRHDFTGRSLQLNGIPPHRLCVTRFGTDSLFSCPSSPKPQF